MYSLNHKMCLSHLWRKLFVQFLKILKWSLNVLCRTRQWLCRILLEWFFELSMLCHPDFQDQQWLSLIGLAMILNDTRIRERASRKWTVQRENDWEFISIAISYCRAGPWKSWEHQAGLKGCGSIIRQLTLWTVINAKYIEHPHIHWLQRNFKHVLS